MFDEQYPTDDTLRLILAADQEEWLNQRINESKGFIGIMLLLLVISVIWAAINYKDAFAYYDGPDCYVLTGEASNNPEIHKEFQAMGMVPCQENDAAKESKQSEIGWKDMQAILTFASLLLILVSTLTLFRHIFQFRKFKGYLVDHRLFLAKYHRL